LDLYDSLQSTAKTLGNKIEVKDVTEQVFGFMMDRLKAYYKDTGVSALVFEAVSAQRPTQPYDFDRRVRAVNYFLTLPEAESLAAANKRISNILRQAEDKGIKVKDKIDESKLTETAERALADQVNSMAQQVMPLFDKRDYETALSKLAGLRETVDTFFDDVMVMVEDESVRDNRLALLNQLRGLFLRVADLSHLQN
jgi:glycyl-tRNA synthetase beta chain